MAKKVYIGVGHGNSDPGAVGNGLKEKELALDVARYLAEDLKRQGIEVKISRTDDKKVWLEERISECNKFKPDFALDIHFNAGGGDGAEVYHSVTGGKGKTLAENILAELKKSVKIHAARKLAKTAQAKIISVLSVKRAARLF